MKTQIKKSIICFMAAVCVLLTFPIYPDAAVTKPNQVSAVSIKREAKDSVLLTWDQVYDAKGYEVYMKSGSGMYKRIKSTSNLQFTKSGLSMGGSYYFKVRAYKTSKGKRIYGKFSPVAKKKMTSYEYLVDVMEPYSSSGVHSFDGATSVQVGGNNYYNGIYIDTWSCYAIYNLNGRYSKISFTYGNNDYYNDGDQKAVFKTDDEVKQIIERKANDLPQSCTIDVKDVYKFEIDVEGDRGYFTLADIKLYF